MNDFEGYQTLTEEFKNSTNKLVISKFESDLFNPDLDVVNLVIRVKRIALPSNGENWKIYHDDKAIFTIEGVKLSKKERLFLRTVDGVNLLIKQVKDGIKNLSALKKDIKVACSE